MPIQLAPDERIRLLKLIKAHFREQHEDELGDLRAGLVLDFFLELLAPAVYNQAIRDAQAWLLRKVEDLDVEVWAPENGTPRQR